MGEFLLGRRWLEELVDRLSEEGLTEEQIAIYANGWVIATVRHVCWLAAEGYPSQEIVKIVNAAVEAADFDLARMPVFHSLPAIL
jgi:hypothetical protein